jgi:hypothetical protein
VRTAYFAQNIYRRGTGGQTVWTVGLGAWDRACAEDVFPRPRRATLPARRGKDTSEVRTLAAILVDPNFALGYTTHGIAKHCLGCSEEAHKWFEGAVAQDLDCPEISLHLQARSSYHWDGILRPSRV